MVLDIPAATAAYLGYDLETVWRLCRKAPRTYNCYCIKKSSGGSRAIYNPSKQTKALQYALLDLVLEGLEVHPSAAAYERNRSIIANARAHAQFVYSVRVDLCNFFPSICPKDLISRIKACRPGISPDEEEFVTKALFVEYRSGRIGLAVGAPSSPKASNAVMSTIDATLTGYAVSRQACYTRYADDLVFSTNAKGESRKFVDEVENLLSRTPSPTLRVNRRKTIFSSPATRRAVTGLVITPEHAISIGRRNKRHVRKLLFDLNRNALDGDRLQYLKGYLAFIKDAEPDFLNKMALRYGASLLALARRGRAPE